MTVTLRQGAGHIRLDVLRTRPDQQSVVLAGAVALVDQEIRDGVVTSGAVLRGTGRRDVALVAELAEDTPSRNRYRVEVVDHIDDRDRSVVESGSSLFTFVNVFTVTPGKRVEMVDYFAHTIPFVRRQPGYVSTNLVVSADSRYAVNIGQYETRRDFLAIFRQPEVVGAFAAGFPRRITTYLGVIPRPPRLRLYELAHVVAA